MGRYVVYPSVSRSHFRYLDCMRLADGERVLRIDTSVDCDSPAYRRFLYAVVAFILMYQAVPLFYLFLIRSSREPPSSSSSSKPGKAPTAPAGRQPQSSPALQRAESSQDPAESLVFEHESGLSDHAAADQADPSKPPHSPAAGGPAELEAKSEASAARPTPSSRGTGAAAASHFLQLGYSAEFQYFEVVDMVRGPAPR